MSNYTIQSNALNKSRVFILQKSELEKRLAPFFYVPELLELERKVLAKKPKKLRDYVVSVSSYDLSYKLMTDCERYKIFSIQKQN